jgi:aspartate/methionine/tyrosine aminotransferase
MLASTDVMNRPTQSAQEVSPRSGHVPLSARSRAIAPFYVMEILKEAARLEASGRRILHLSIGEPDFTAAPAVIEAAQAALVDGRTHYTAALGLPALREAIAHHYAQRHQAAVDPARIVITSGASGALLLALGAAIDPGDEFLLADPSYPCNRNFVSALGGRPVLLPCGPQSRFQLTAEAVEAAWSAATRGVLLATPSNPTGTSILPNELARIAAHVRDRQGVLLVDEIYHELCYEHPPISVLASEPDAVVINSFSKYFAMTGWRLGWLVVPPEWVSAIERMAQNLYICAPAVSQHAALACFEPESMALYDTRRQEFQRRRDYLVSALNDLGIPVPVRPDGAFYIYADVSAHTDDSAAWANDLLQRAGVCLVPGTDFGFYDTQRYVRLSYATALETLQEAMERLRVYLANR